MAPSPLSLTYGQFAIGTTKYTLSQEFILPAPGRLEVCHLVSYSTTFPTSVIGYDRPSCSPTFKVLGSALTTLIADILGSDTERRLSWVQGGVEVYVLAKGGKVTSQAPFSVYHGAATDKYLVSASFGLTRSKLYKASDDTVLWGS